MRGDGRMIRPTEEASTVNETSGDRPTEELGEDRPLRESDVTEADRLDEGDLTESEKLPGEQQ